MTLRSICTRTATIALAAIALAAPAASAQPADAPALAETTVAAQEHQDLRSADAIDAATPTSASQDLRSADAIDAAAPPALDLQANATPEASADRGIPWATIAIGSLLVLCLIGGIAGRTRRTARARLSA